MRNDIKARVISEAKYILRTKGTIRSTAKHFSVSKSTVHIDLAKKLKSVNKILYKRVQRLLKHNWDERGIRGALATKESFKRKRREFR